jgi:hypothetical protein
VNWYSFSDPWCSNRCYALSKVSLAPYCIARDENKEHKSPRWLLCSRSWVQLTSSNSKKKRTIAVQAARYSFSSSSSLVTSTNCSPSSTNVTCKEYKSPRWLLCNRSWVQLTSSNSKKERTIPVQTARYSFLSSFSHLTSTNRSPFSTNITCIKVWFNFWFDVSKYTNA